MSMNMSGLARYLRKVGADVKPRVSTNLGRAAQYTVGVMKREIGNMHAVDTGNMRNSVTAHPLNKYTYFVGPTVGYSVYVAEGTSRMPARPFHRTTASIIRNRIKDLM